MEGRGGGDGSFDTLLNPKSRTSQAKGSFGVQEQTNGEKESRVMNLRIFGRLAGVYLVYFLESGTARLCVCDYDVRYMYNRIHV